MQEMYRSELKRDSFLKKYFFRNFISLLVFFFWSNSLFSQRFSEDSVKFIKELDGYFQEFSADKKEASKWVDDFQEFWKNPLFTASYKASVYKYCNAMASKKLKPTPFFKDFLTAVSNYINNNLPPSRYSNWTSSLDKVLAVKGNKVTEEFLELSANLFSSNTFYKSPTYEWQSATSEYVFEYDSLPKVTFPKLNLRGLNSRGDTIEIINTRGVYYPKSGRFYGNGGMVSWKRVGLDSSVFAILKKFSVDCKTGGYTADTAVFHYPKYLTQAQTGRVTDKIITERENPTYPRFDSYSKRMVVKNVAQDADFEGGFAIRGAKFAGSGDAKNPARLIFKRDQKPFLEVGAQNFLISKEMISSVQATVKFILNQQDKKDSIYHPGLNFRYQIEQKKVSFIRTDDGMQKSPFYSSFHKMDIYVEEMTWKLDEPKIDMDFISGNFQGEAYFESEDFYVPARVQDLQGFDDVNPLFKIDDFYNKNGKNKTFTAAALAGFMRRLAVDLRPTLIKMTNIGLLYFNPVSDSITLKDKLFNYVNAARKTRDYDVLTVHSVLPGKTNAVLNLVSDNFDLVVKGVKSILLSDSQKVFVFPRAGEVTLKRNRDMVFQGVVSAGKFEFFGKDFYYSYHNNKIDLRNVDSLRIFVNPFDDDVNIAENKFRKVATLIENINGELVVDHPSSHSGRLGKPEYPIFKSMKVCYAFYDKKSIQRGAYNRDKFYFKLDPFTIDSLDNFTNKALRFDGEFSSAGIFPNFRETLQLQKDYSLGFVRKTPPGGFVLYDGKAKFDNEIRLSNKGLSGDGTIEFGPSVTQSDNFIYYPDSMNGVANTFDVKEMAVPDEFPQAHGEQVKIHWMPYKDLMQASDIKKPFDSYNGGVKFSGRYELHLNELRGSGKAEFEKADLLSRNILFKQKKFFSDTSDFHLKAFDDEGFTFSTDNVKATIDFVARTGEFVSNGKGSVVRFDKNQYICFMERFKWYMDSEDIQIGDEQKKIDAEVEDNINIEGPEFISIHPKQDSLRFFSPAAKYNLRKCIIHCINVPFINVADARFYPDSGKVTLFKNAVMDTLENAKILANTVSKFHTIRNVKANIFSRKNYIASGMYTYLDENKKSYPIYFEKIRPDTAGKTISNGFISEKDDFHFNDFFSFAGRVQLSAPNQFLFFEGGTKMVHNCSRIGKSYLKFSGEIDPAEIFIPIPENPIDVEGKSVVNAVMYSPDTSGVYSGFVSPKSTRNDKEIISANGFLTFDKETGEYRISSKEKLIEQNLPGNYLSLNLESCTVYGEGKFDIGADFGQVEFKTVGNATHFSVNDSASIRLMSTLNFYFEDKALRKMVSDIEVYLNTLAAVDFSSASFKKGLTEIMGKEKSDKAIAELELNGKFRRFPDELEKSFFFSDLNFVYNGKLKSFVTVGHLGISNILKQELNRYVPGMIKIDKMKSGGDRITLYLELDNSTWYYFEYFKGVMKAVSSNPEFNQIIKEVKAKKRKMDVEKGPSYQYILGNEKLKNTFITKYGFKR
jgi:hypothetical protein